MAWTIIDHAGDGGSGASWPEVTIDSTGADLIVVALYNGLDTFDSSTLVDSEANVYVPLTPAESTLNVGLLYCAAPVNDAALLLQWQYLANFTKIAVMAISGSAASPFDVENGASGNSTTAQAGSVTPTVSSALAIAALHHADPISSIDSGYTLVENIDNTWWGGLAYKEVSAATNPEWTATGSNVWSATNAIFKPAGGGGGGRISKLAGEGGGLVGPSKGLVARGAQQQWTRQQSGLYLRRGA